MLISTVLAEILENIVDTQHSVQDSNMERLRWEIPEDGEAFVDEEFVAGYPQAHLSVGLRVHQPHD